MIDYEDRMNGWAQTIRDSYNNPPRLRPVQAGPDYCQRTEYYWLDHHVGTFSPRNDGTGYVSTALSNPLKVKMAECRNWREAEAWLMENVRVCKNYVLSCQAVDAVIRLHEEGRA